MAYTQADLDRLDAAIAAEELEVEADGVRTRYRSMTELMAARQHVADQLRATAPAATRRPATMYFRMAGSRD
jgi:hypothetical protein